MSTAKCVPPPNASRCLQFPGRENRTTITAAEFKQWLKQFDTDHDGRINRRELREAIRRRGAWFAGLRARSAVRRADKNHNGVVDEWDTEHIIDLAERELGFKITAADAVPPPAERVREERPTRIIK